MARPFKPPGRSLEASGNARRRWMATPRCEPRRGQDPAYRPAPGLGPLSETGGAPSFQADLQSWTTRLEERRCPSSSSP